MKTILFSVVAALTLFATTAASAAPAIDHGRDGDRSAYSGRYERGDEQRGYSQRGDEQRGYSQQRGYEQRGYQGGYAQRPSEHDHARYEQRYDRGPVYRQGYGYR